MSEYKSKNTNEKKKTKQLKKPQLDEYSSKEEYYDELKIYYNSLPDSQEKRNGEFLLMKNSLNSIENKSLQNEKVYLFKKNNEEKIKNTNTYFVSLFSNTAFIFGLVGFIEGNGIQQSGSLTSLCFFILSLLILAFAYVVKRYSL